LASVELFDPDPAKEEGFQINCGINETGTTSLGSPKLSMAAKFRARYGKSKLKYPVFARGSMVPEGAATEFKELRLRSHSHDTFFWLALRENPTLPYGSPPVTRGGDAQLARNVWIDELQLLMGQPGQARTPGASLPQRRVSWHLSHSRASGRGFHGQLLSRQLG
jgi:hypothetical protein